ncbi:hypothetical protein DFH94DRAFT_756382 [Russula ochroleuca]|uniref:Secreted protein n=1 Tax=Russula ochroleuca TaxID=152965 RepID=A0A9P5MRZ1_9AGAM|nr:hypothetical protein DFH94DRAFT_756382 [Russula ochroleuca]
MPRKRCSRRSLCVIPLALIRSVSTSWKRCSPSAISSSSLAWLQSVGTTIRVHCLPPVATLSCPQTPPSSSSQHQILRRLR